MRPRARALIDSSACGWSAPKPTCDRAQDYERAERVRREWMAGAPVLSRSTAEHRLKRDIREAYRDLFEQGKRMAGNLTSTTKDEERVLEKLRYDEFLYAHNFLEPIRKVLDARRFLRKRQFPRRVQHFSNRFLGEQPQDNRGRRREDAIRRPGGDVRLGGE